jgi:outer membrane protein
MSERACRWVLTIFAILCPNLAHAADLLELYDQTLSSNPTIRAGEFEVERANAQKSAALSRLLPQVSAVGNLGWNQSTSPEFDVRTGGTESITRNYQSVRGLVQARQSLFDLPSYLRWEGASAGIRQRELELAAVQMSITADLVDRYLKVLEAQDTLNYLDGERLYTQQQLGRLRSMRERQLVAVTDVYEVEAYEAALETHTIEAQNAVDTALEALRELAGVPVPEVQPLAAGDLPEIDGDAAAWVQRAVQTNPKLTALQQGIESARKLTAGARAEHLPQLALQMSETYSDNGGFDNRQVSRYDVGTIGLQLTVPLYEGGATNAGIRDATAQRSIAEQQFEEQFRKIERETRTAYLDAKTAKSRIKSSRREVEARDKARDAQEHSYEHRLTTIVDVLEAKKNLLRARVEQAKARYEYLRAGVTLRLWAGSLARSDIEELNVWLRAE